MEQDKKRIFFIAVILACLFSSYHVSRFIYTNNEFQKKQSEACSNQWTISETVKEYEQNPFLPPNYASLKSLTKPELIDIYWRYINSLQVLCRNQTRLGSIRDGGKEVCVDDLYKPREPCLVYSFGSAFRFDFEEGVLRHYRCEVHTFDPRVLDLLKIDIEGAEWPAFLEMIQSGVLKDVKQICVEIHLGRDMARKLTILRQLYEQGFHIFMHEHNLFSVTPSKYLKRAITLANEISLINVNWKEVYNRRMHN